ncbi:MAG: RagB/SusD family nutrient uptake outer membrane protein [Gemmatimonadetes bacterium]|nr:RagB/SusD family nutrient uptake outer membrane protein [Gemmatimonadota bacterium]
MLQIKNLHRFVALGAMVGSVVGCSDLLTVSDPSRFTDEDLDKALPAVATGVEGDLHAVIDSRINDVEILSDVMMHSGTWAGWDDIDHGRIDYNNDGRNDGGSGLLRTRFAAQDAQARFDRLEAEGETISSSLRAQVTVSEGWADLLLGMWYCEGPAGAGTAAITDMQLYAQARDKLTAALTHTGGTDFEWWARAGIARMELYLGNFAAADAAAGAVLAGAPAGWSKDALYQTSVLSNSIVTLSTFGFNHASAIREKWWGLVDDTELKMNDPLSQSLLGLDEPDPRVEIRHEDGVLGVDGTTDFHSQWKYKLEGSDIPFTHLDEMRLIQAEVAWAAADYTTARTILNGLRTTAGLTPIPDAMADDNAEVLTLLMNERFAELFMEGHRMEDIRRHGLVPGLIADGSFAGTEATRPVKFPISVAEARDNPEMEDDASVRCLPTAS